MNRLVQPLFEGPIDVVGDVHGELDALRSLIAHLIADSSLSATCAIADPTARGRTARKRACECRDPKRNLYRVDSSVGGRFRERRERKRQGLPADARFEGRLAAVRWPERSVMFDDGSIVEASN